MLRRDMILGLGALVLGCAPAGDTFTCRRETDEERVDPVDHHVHRFPATAEQSACHAWSRDSTAPAGEVESAGDCPHCWPHAQRTPITGGRHV